MDADSPSKHEQWFVLVPHLNGIECECEQNLRELEKEGVRVVRRGGCSAIDVARNELSDLGYNLLGSSDTDFNCPFDVFDNNNHPGLANALAPNNALPGYQKTLLLQATSPGYDKGDPTLAGETDERGSTRQVGQGRKVSIGAEDPDATIIP